MKRERSTLGSLRLIKKILKVDIVYRNFFVKKDTVLHNTRLLEQEFCFENQLALICLDIQSNLQNEKIYSNH